MVWLEEFQRKGEVKPHFLEQFYIKGMSQHKINPLERQRDQNNSILYHMSCHIENISRVNAYTSQILLQRENQAGGF